MLSLSKLNHLMLFFAILVISFLSCKTEKKEKDYAWKGEYLQQPYKIEYSDQKGRDFKTEIDSIIKQQVNLFDDNSPASFSNAFNKENESKITDKHVSYVIEKSLNISKSTGGAFDITFLPLMIQSQQYSVDQLVNDTAGKLDSVRAFVNYQLLDLEKRHSNETGKSSNITYLNKKDKRVKIMLGGIYKGYVVDEVARFLEEKKIRHYYVEIGETPHAKCSGEMNHEWSVVIKRPSENETVSHKTGNLVINLASKGLACSGTDIEVVLKDGKLITKYIDPRTGRLVNNRMLNAIVVAPETITADALATTFMIMGKEKSLEYIQNHPEVDAILIYSDPEGNIDTYYTGGLKQKVRQMQ